MWMTDRDQKTYPKLATYIKEDFLSIADEPPIVGALTTYGGYPTLGAFLRDVDWGSPPQVLVTNFILQSVKGGKGKKVPLAGISGQGASIYIPISWARAFQDGDDVGFPLAGDQDAPTIKAVLLAALVQRNLRFLDFLYGNSPPADGYKEAIEKFFEIGLGQGGYPIMAFN